MHAHLSLAALMCRTCADACGRRYEFLLHAAEIGTLICRAETGVLYKQWIAALEEEGLPPLVEKKRSSVVGGLFRKSSSVGSPRN